MRPSDLLTKAAATFPNRVAFRIPKSIISGEATEQWTPITFKEFHTTVCCYAKYWHHVLQQEGIKKRDVVVLWIEGFAYHEIVHVFALIEGGYIPQCIPSRLQNPSVVYELAAISGAKALLYHPSVQPPLNCPMFTHEVRELGLTDIAAYTSFAGHDEEPNSVSIKPNDIVAIYHTSGSTGNLPKLVKFTAKAVAVMAEKHTGRRKNSKPSTRIWMGSVAHAGQFFATNLCIVDGDCIVQPFHHPYTPSHFVTMVRECSVNVLTIWSPSLSQIIRAAKQDQVVLSTLQSLDIIVTSGAPFPPDELKWGHENGLSIVNYFALTEAVGAILHTVPMKTSDPAPTLFRPVPGIGVIFSPASNHPGFEGIKLLELVVSSSSPLFPGPSFASSIDGHLHTGDFFEEILPGRYKYRGRIDDWIKMSNATRCDAKAIEDYLRLTCPDLISECVVVGSGRVCPAIFIERHISFQGHDDELKREIVRRSIKFNSRRYTNEQVPGETLIFVVDRGELPRTVTKGNVRRKAVEDKYRTVLDGAYLVTPKL
ncbi:hypothetical protein QCA50_005225 [Cerrena zonata]|uniref:AMP-dependent synthetase/ligase domain-containing protein n=1 Tax=Cerrena zonata TaxID=2478898 RepID=A0AAW0GEL1_9APHY